MLNQAGLRVIVAAGNSGVPVSGISPASANVTTVAASDQSDEWAGFNNYGNLVDIIAPGVTIQSIWPNQLQAIMSGTSMAAAIYSGMVLAGAQLKDATINAIKNVKMSPNLFSFIEPRLICVPQLHDEPQMPFLLKTYLHPHSESMVLTVK